MQATYAHLQPGMQPLPPLPKSHAYTHEGRKYELHVVQQPRRARMCGFGDKDRRPITPPPCVRLVITDESGREVDPNTIDFAMFVLNVDLWSEDGTREVNLVRHSNTSPTSSNTPPISYNQPLADDAGAAGAMANAEAKARAPAQQGYQLPPGYQVPYPPGGPPPANPYAQQQALPSPPYERQPGQYQPAYALPPNGNQYPQQNAYNGGPPPPHPPQRGGYYTGAAIHTQGHGPPLIAGGGPIIAPDGSQIPSIDLRNVIMAGGPRGPMSNTQPTGMFTRNLIGSLAASAFRLTDPNDHIGIWFVLQDLSVRTEGHFRLRFSFVNVGAVANQPVASPLHPNIQAPVVNTGRAPVLAACFSDVFTVYSAKKFPGVVESTHLSRCFATQGIKIPIRKDGPGGKKDGREEYDED